MWHEYYNPKLGIWLNAGANYYHNSNPQTEKVRNFHPDSSHKIAIRNCKCSVIRTVTNRRRKPNHKVYYRIVDRSITGCLTLLKIETELEILALQTIIQTKPRKSLY